MAERVNIMQQARFSRRKKLRGIHRLIRNLAAVVFLVAALALTLQAIGHRSGAEEDSPLSADDTYTAYDGLGTEESGSAARSGVQSDVLKKLREMAGDNPEIAAVVDHSGDYPGSLLELLSKNEETLQFVLDYPDHKDDTPPDTIGDVTEGEIPLLLQWDERWGYTTYGTDYLAVTGCGPTCLSMVAAGLNGDNTITPNRVAEFAMNNGYYVDGAGSAWSLMTEGCWEYGLSSQELPLDENRMKNELTAGNPIICSMLPGDFTQKGHFIVIVGVEDGMFRVNDPNSRIRSGQLWSYERISTQIGNLWAFYKA